jgi:pyruvate dehydrogenase E2 component (dihydrolipoamide acetyltransferase)
VPIEILMPALSPTMTEGNLAKWVKKEGDKVKPGDVLAEIETDKATMEVESIDEGTIGKILVPAGTQNVPVNNLIALLLEEDESADALANYTPKTIAVKKSSEASPKAPVKADTVATKEVTTPTQERIKASPLAKRIAKNEKIDLTKLSGTGPRGRIVKDDVLKANTQKPASLVVERNTNEYTAIPNTNVRKIIASRLLESKQTVPHFYLSIDCNIDKLMYIRKELNESTDQFKLSINDFVIKAVALALAEVPEANASWTEDSILQYNNVDVSVAVALEDGLITPIIHNADQKPIAQVSNDMKSLAKRARTTGLRPEEFQGGGFSISNLGMYGINNFKAIVNPPQACILAIGASNKRPIVINDEITIATIMDVSLSCDHRVVDGAVGAKFLTSFKKFMENPLKMLVLS